MVTLLATSAGSQAPAGLTPTSQPVNLLYADSCKQAGALVHPATQEVTITKYEGSRAADGLFDGKGYAEFTSGNKYNGDFERGQMHGHGEYVWTDGLIYTGDFVNNRITGTGGYQWPSGASYQGGVLNGKRSGFGSMQFAGNEVVYTGQWLDSKRHGQGKLMFDKAQKCFYEGAWKDNLKHGQGTMRYSSGNTYSGGWDGDQKHGQGCMQWGEGEVYTGQWAAGLQNGLGQHVWIQPTLPGATQGSNHAFFLMHNRYEGEFQNGQRHGYGTLYYATGAKYQGQWQLEQKHGRGVFTFEDRTVFDGMFAHDQPVLKAGEPWGPAGPGIKLRVHDLLEDREDKQAVLSMLSNELLCVNTELRVIYDAYSSRQQGMPWGWNRPKHSAAVTSSQLWQLMRDCHVPEPDCCLAHINTALAQACAAPPQLLALQQELAPLELSRAGEASPPPLHDPTRQLLFCDFCEALVRVAHLKYRHLPSLQQRLHHLLHGHILPLAVQSGMSRLWLPQQGEEALHALHSATPALQPLFLQIAAHDQDSIGMNTSSAACLQGVVEGCTAAVQVSSSIAGGKQQSSADSSGCSLNGSRDQELLAWTATTASLRLVLQVMQQRQLLGTGVSLQQALVAFQDACYPCSQADQQGQACSGSLSDILNLDSRITFPEFVEGVAKCCSQEIAATGQAFWLEPFGLLLTKLKEQGV